MSTSGAKIEDYAEVAARLDAESEGIAALEINVSCPNVKEGGLAFGTDPVMMGKVVSAVRASTRLPLITKLSPNVTKIADFARAAEASGSDMVSLINTIPAMAIDIETFRPKIANITGGLSGPAVKPVAVRMVYQCAHAVKIPIIGMGGIRTAQDALEMILAGATAVSMGTASFHDQTTVLSVIDGMMEYLERHNIPDIRELIGCVG